LWQKLAILRIFSEKKGFTKFPLKENRQIKGKKKITKTSLRLPTAA